MGDYEMQLAEKEFGRWFVSKRTKLANAAGHYLTAANKYKTAKEYKKSAGAFEKHANALVTLGESMFKICESYKNAAVQLKLAQDPRCMEMYDKAVNVLCDQGKHQRAAEMCKKMAELSAKTDEHEIALMHYEKAIDLYQSDDFPVQARRCLEKVAEINVSKDPPDFSKAAEVFEEVAKTALEERLTRSTARKHFFRAALCIIAEGDAVLAREKGDLFLRLDPSLGTGREGKLMMKLIKALEDYDAVEFTQCVTDYNEISKFDAWHVKVLLAGKAHIDPEMSSSASASAGAAKTPTAAGGGSAAASSSTSTAAAAYTKSAGSAAAASATSSAGSAAAASATSSAGSAAAASATSGAGYVSEPVAKAPPSTEEEAPALPSADIGADPDSDEDDGAENFFG